MDFDLEFYETLSGHKLAEEFIDDLAISNPVLAKQVAAGAGRLKDRRMHKPPLSEHIHDDLFALRVGFGNIARVFYTIRGRKIWFLDGYVKKVRGYQRNSWLMEKSLWMNFIGGHNERKLRQIYRRTV
jgi:hypothetical protein